MTDWTIHQGDAFEVLQGLSEGLAQTCVTSPPYWGLRDYGVDGQIGLEDELHTYVEHLCDIFDEVKRVLRDDGTLWLNLGDCYASESYGNRLQSKDLCMMPSRVAMELQRRGWYLRSRIVWHKPSTMPESVTDRPTSAHEYIFLLSPSERYFYDADAIREKSVDPEGAAERYEYNFSGTERSDPNDHDRIVPEGQREFDGTRNKRDVWSVNPAAFPDAHFAVYPTELIKPCVLAGTSAEGQCVECGAPLERDVERRGGPQGRHQHDDGVEMSDEREEALCDGQVTGAALSKRYREHGYPERVHTGWSRTCGCGVDGVESQTVLDPFCGAGTTGVVAAREGRDFVGVELNEDYIDMANRRIAETVEEIGELNEEQAEYTESQQLGLLRY